MSKKIKDGRPTTYTPELGDLVCDGIISGLSLKKICLDDSLPTSRTVFTWLRTYPDFLRNYDRAKEDQAKAMVEDALDIADNEEIEVGHKNIMVNTRKWASSKYDRKRFGDHQIIDTTVVVKHEDLTDEELDALIQAKSSNE